MLHRFFYALIWFSYSYASNSTFAILNFKNIGLESSLASEFYQGFQNELLKMENMNIIDQDLIESHYINEDIDPDNCDDSCMIQIGKTVGATEIISAVMIYNTNLYTSVAKTLNVKTAQITKETTFSTEKKDELTQFGIYYLTRKLMGINVPEKFDGKKMYTVTIESIMIDDKDFFRSSFGEPYPINVIVTENENLIWRLDLASMRGFRTLKESITLAFDIRNDYEIQIFDMGFPRESMYYRLSNNLGTWPFDTSKHQLGDHSYINFKTSEEHKLAFQPNKIIKSILPKAR